MVNNMRFYYRVSNLRGALTSAFCQLTKTVQTISVTNSSMRSPLKCRVPSTDLFIYDQIIGRDDLKFEVNRDPKFIIDAGANIGITSILFASRFPEAKIIAIEPEEENYQLLCENVAAYPNVIPLQAALWHVSGRISLMDPNQGECSYVANDEVSATNQAACFKHLVDAITVDEVLTRFGIDHLDILKMDIEGSEKEVIEHCETWIHKVDAIMVELHDRIKPGCSRVFYSQTVDFDKEWVCGEYVYVVRDPSCLVASKFELIP